MAVFGRKVILAIGQAGADGLAFSDLRVNFKVKMSRSGTPNEATIRIWNINPVSATILDGPLPTVTLSVGYQDPLAPPGTPAIPRIIFRGDVIQNGVTITREGPDRIMQIEAKDGGRTYQTGRITLAFPTTVTMSAVIAQIAAQLLLPIGTITVVPDVVMTQGATYNGQARDILDGFASSVNADWFINDGVFFFIPKGTPTPLVAPLFSSLAGNLIGTPVKKDRGGIEAVALIDASIRPGGTFVMQSNSINGTYIASDVLFTGDSGFDTPFYVIVTGKLPGL